MAKLAVFFVAVLAFHAALAAPKKNQGQQGGTQKNQLEEVVNDVSAAIHNALPDEKQIQQTSQQFVQNVETIIQKLDAEIAKNKGTTDNILREVTTKLTENINALKQAVGPDATAKATEIKTELDNHFKNAATEVEKLVKIVQPNIQQAADTTNTFAKGILDDFVKAANDLKTQVDNAIQGSPKKAKN